jgi:hypothetical protein
MQNLLSLFSVFFIIETSGKINHGQNFVRSTAQMVIYGDDSKPGYIWSLVQGHAFSQTIDKSFFYTDHISSLRNILTGEQ